MFDTPEHSDLTMLEDQAYKDYIYTDKADPERLKEIKEKYPNLDFIVRDKNKWNIRYITGVIMDPNVKVIVIHDIDELSIAEISLASFMCKIILCVTDTVKEYDKIYEMVSDLQTGCNLTINNNSFSHWYKSKRF